MATPLSVPGSSSAAPPPSVYRIEIPSEHQATVQAKVSSLSRTALYGRVVGTPPSVTELRDWIRSSLAIQEGRISTISFHGRGIFSIQLSDEASAAALLARSPLPAGNRFIFFTAWYPQFDVDTFDSQHNIPQFPVTLSFPGLSLELRDLLFVLASPFGRPIRASAVTTVTAPRIQVLALTSQQYPDYLDFTIGDRSYHQKLVVTGRPDQCLRCNLFGHRVKDCPKQQRRRPQQPQHQQPSHQRPAGPSATAPGSTSSFQPPSVPSQEQGGQGAWQQPPRRHTFHARPPPAAVPPGSVSVALEEEIEPLPDSLALVPADSILRDIQQNPLQFTPLPNSFSRRGRGRTSSSNPPPDPLPSPLPPAFISSSPPQWGLERAQTSGDGPAPLEVRLYLPRHSQSSSQLLGSVDRPMRSFLLRLSDGEVWDEALVLQTLYSQISQQLTNWVGPHFESLLSSQFSGGIGAAFWLDGADRFCLPVVLIVSESWDPPVSVSAWEFSRLVSHFSCQPSYLTEWFTAVTFSVEGRRLPCLPPSSDLDISSPRATQEPKRRRN